MSNLDTIKAIEDNLSAIILAQGFMLEDSSEDQKRRTKPLCALRHTGEEFGDEYGQKPDYNDIRYTLRISFSDSAPGTTRDKTAEYAHKIRNNVTVNALNVGGLVSSKLIFHVAHEGYSITGEGPPETEMEYRLRIRYRET